MDGAAAGAADGDGRGHGERDAAAVREGAAATVAAALFAVDPAGLGGVVLRAGAGPARERWLAALKAVLPAAAPWRRVPAHIHDDRLLGGLDLTASLHAGRAVAQRGLLAEADGGIVLLAMAERLPPAAAAHIAAVLDAGELVVERHGIGACHASRFGVVALDEGRDDDERLPARLRERLAFHLAPAALPPTFRGDRFPLDGDDDEPAWTAADIAAARQRHAAGVRLDDAIVQGLCATALALGIDSMRAPLLACRAARAAAALAGRAQVEHTDATLAAALVLAPRATRLPSPADAPADPGAPDAGDDARDAQDRRGAHDQAPPDTAPGQDPAEDPGAAGRQALDDVVLQAAVAAIPAGLLASLALGLRGAARARSGSAGGGAARKSATRGRPIGAEPGAPGRGARLCLIDTLRAAAPWQALRRREAAAATPGAAPRLHVRREDLRVWRFEQRSETTTVFVVDASGSSALHRLAEAKGAVELLLADCYVRRDSVAVIAFRGRQAEVLLPPTRSLARAKRSLAGLPGGGGTPLAAGLDAALALAVAIRRRGATPLLVLLTDGRANIARDGSPGRARATDDALAAARGVRAEGLSALLIDTSPQPQDAAGRLATEMGARYVPLPHAGAAGLSQLVRSGGAVARPAPH